MEHNFDILLVEDNPNDADLILRALRKKSLADLVARARDGQEALDFFFAQPHMPCVRVILLDLKMPKVSGLEVLRQIKADPRTKCIPVVVLTSSQARSDILECYRLGANSYIVKPMELRELTQVIGDLGTYWVRSNHLPA